MSGSGTALVELSAGGEPAARLVCLPYAGAGPAVYRPWAAALSQVEVLVLQLSGRGRRLDDPLHTEVAQVVDELLDALAHRSPLPTVLQGHSLGAVLAHATAIETRRRGRDLPAGLVLSGCIPPGHPRTVPRIHGLPDTALIGALRRLGGVPEPVLENGELMDLLLPVLRADIRMAERWRCPDPTPLDLSIRAVAGASDPVAPPDAMRAWAAFATGRFDARVLPGGHFFPFESESAFPTLLSESLQQAAGVDFARPNARLSTGSRDASIAPNEDSE